MELKVSKNGHRLEMADGTPFLWLGDTEWVLNNHSDEQIIEILDDRKAKGFSVIQVCAVREWERIVYTDASGVESNLTDLSWARTDFNGNTPFINDDVKFLNPAYWERWRWICQQVNQRGMCFVIMAGSPGRMEGRWKCSGPEECYIYGKNVGTIFRSCTNIILSPSMDFPGDRGVGTEGWRALAKGFKDGMGADGQEKSIPVPMTYHTWQTSSVWFHRDAWLTFNGVQGSRNEETDNDRMIYQRTLQDYLAKEPVKPVVCLEGSYEEERNNGGKLPPTTTRNVRMQLFYAFFAGASGYTYGHVDNWIQHESTEYLNSPGGNWIPVARDFLLARKWWRFVPFPTLIVGGEESGDKRKVAVVADDGSECCVFFPEQDAVELNLEGVFKESTMEICWFDPRNGYTTAGERIALKGNRHFSPPQGWEDAVLIIKS